ncbi:GGDEF domain-containing protein [Bacillus sp. DNRA2]|uniref:GGDEF domain-containing protein n=1 Tax=Bacillus sp. DNRA2 TaxID=2723053 RepID=UPI00145C9330|nr:GGDEF domain-containing protein [Bacillus sp. DNRA2]NMD68659.1 GGDEF domain-containing protein [Bacillus sp. DNRA2]
MIRNEDAIMEYTGRVFTTIFVIVLCIVMWSIDGLTLNYFHLLALSFFSGIAWWMGSQYDKAKYNSEKDELTNLYNRRFVQMIAPNLIALARRKNKKICISFVDVDNFKPINDMYGHEIGDKILHDIAAAILKVTRENDIVARWGGDEILVISPLVKTKNPELLIRRIEEELNEVSRLNNIIVSVSIGTAIFPDDGMVLSELIKEADRKMYLFKAAKKTTYAKKVN